MGFLKTIFTLVLLGIIGYSIYVAYLLMGLGWLTIGLFFIICLISLVYLSKVEKW